MLPVSCRALSHLTLITIQFVKWFYKGHTCLWLAHTCVNSCLCVGLWIKTRPTGNSAAHYHTHTHCHCPHLWGKKQWGEEGRREGCLKASITINGRHRALWEIGHCGAAIQPEVSSCSTSAEVTQLRQGRQRTELLQWFLWFILLVNYFDI